MVYWCSSGDNDSAMNIHLFEQMKSIRILTVPPIFASARFADLVTLKEVAEVRTLWALQTRRFLLLHITSLSERARFVRCLGVQICTSFDSELRSVCATWQGSLKRFKLGSCKLQRKKQRQVILSCGCGQCGDGMFPKSMWTVVMPVVGVTGCCLLSLWNQSWDVMDCSCVSGNGMLKIVLHCFHTLLYNYMFLFGY